MGMYGMYVMELFFWHNTDHKRRQMTSNLC